MHSEIQHEPHGLGLQRSFDPPAHALAENFSSPAPPDYTGAANAQGAASERIAAQQTAANRPNISTPFGSINWTHGNVGGPNDHFDGSSYRGDPNAWYGSVDLPPEVLQTLQGQQDLQLGRTNFAQGLLGQAEDSMRNPLDFSGLPAVGNGEDARNRAESAIYGRETSRLDPMWAQREQAAQAQLAAQGIDPTSEAGRNASDNLGRQRNDAYQQATFGAIMGGGAEASRQQGMDMNARRQALSELLQRREQPFNELQAMLSGQQVGMPQFPGFNGASAGQAPNLLGAASAQGNFDMQSYAAQMQMLSGLFGGLGMVGGAGLRFA